MDHCRTATRALVVCIDIACNMHRCHSQSESHHGLEMFGDVTVYCLSGGVPLWKICLLGFVPNE